MADKDEKAPSEAPSKDKPTAEQVTDVNTLTNGKFKSPEDLVKAYGELEKKLGEQGDEIRQSREFATVVQPLLEVVKNDPELFKQNDAKLRNEPTSDESDTKKEDKTTVQDVEVRGSLVDMAIAKFEQEHGIDKLSAEERKSIRQKIGDEVYDLTGRKIDEVDLRRLSPILDKAYILANKDNLVDKSKLEALVSANGEKEGAIPGVPSSSEKTETQLSPDEAKVAEKFGLTREEYISGKSK